MNPTCAFCKSPSTHTCRHQIGLLAMPDGMTIDPTDTRLYCELPLCQECDRSGHCHLHEGKPPNNQPLKEMWAVSVRGNCASLAEEYQKRLPAAAAQGALFEEAS